MEHQHEVRVTTAVTIVAITVMVIAAACGGSDEKSGSSPRTQTPVASATPTAALPQTYSSPGGALTFGYPAGWIAQNAGHWVMLATDHTLLQSDPFNSQLATGQAAIVLMAPYALDNLIQSQGLEHTARAVAMYTAEGLAETILAEPISTMAGASPATLIRGHSALGERALLTLDLGDDLFAALIIATAPGELELHEPSLLAIAGSLAYANPRLLATLRGHTDDVEAVAFSPDGGRIASGSSDETIRLWDATSGASVLTIDAQETGARIWVRDIAYSRDGTHLISCSALMAARQPAGTIRLWDARTGQLMLTIPSGSTAAIAVNPDGTILASGSSEEDGTVSLWDAASGESQATLTDHTDYITDVAFSPDGTVLASASGDGTVRLWDTATGQPIRVLEGHGASVVAVAYSPDGTTLASGGEDGTVRLWNAATGDLRMTLSGHTGRVLAVAFSADGARLASGGAEETIRLWDATTGAPQAVLEGHSFVVWDVAFSPDGTRLASAGDDGTVRIWDVTA
ncbi:MAG: WD40 repeat domain-containing protein [Chloroflexota bacterium]|jgi:hypothetical protein